MIDALRCTPSLLAKVLFALKGGRRFRALATEPTMGTAEELSMLPLESVLLRESMLLLDGNPGKVSAAPTIASFST